MQNLLEVKSSKIRGAGKGAFARVNICEGTRVGEYKGKVLTAAAYDRLRDKAYVYEVAKKVNGRYQMHYIDARLHKRNNPLRYVNGARTAVQKKKINVEAYQYAETIYYRSIRDIAAGEEIIIDYGDSYWE